MLQKGQDPWKDGVTMATKKLSEFGRAFADARKSGMKEFTFKGKRYHTRTADEEKQPEAQFIGDKKPVLGEQGPRRPEYKITDVDRPGTRVKYENEDADMPTFRKGGYVKAADGIAKKGKTRGMMV